MRSIARVVVAATLISSIGAIGVASEASAATACPTRSMSKTFSQWGDDNLYFVAPQATFEGGVGQWARGSGARVVADQAPWRVNGAGHSKAMQLPSGASITLNAFCVAANEETLRFFYKSPGSGQLSVRMEVTTAQGTAVSAWGFGTSTQGWDVSPIIKLPSMRNADGDQWITLTISASGGTWLIDDVMIDPWISR